MYHHDGRDKGVAVLETREYCEAQLKKRLDEGRQKSAAGLKLLVEDGRSIEDYLMTCGKGRFQKDAPLFSLHDDAVCMRVNDIPRRLTNHSTGQLSEKLGLGVGAWLKELNGGAAWQKKLAVDILNDYEAHKVDDIWLVRSTHDRVRGVLSKQYGPWESWRVIRGFQEAIQARGAQMVDATVDETRVYAEAMIPDMQEIDLGVHGEEFCNIGAFYRSSDFGDGAQVFSLFIERTWCTNKATSKNILRNVHLGANLGKQLESSGISLSPETYKLTTDAHMSAIRDASRQLFEPKYVQQQIALMQHSATKEVAADFVNDRLPKMGLSKEEADWINGILVENNPAVVPAGPLTYYKVGQAVAAAAHREGVVVRHKHELQEVAGKLIFGNGNGVDNNN